VDFTSALYLGLAHGSRSLEWTELTTGRPAALQPTPGSTTAAARFAALVGCERALALTSTLHAFMDLFARLGRAVVLYDAGVYPIARWAMERAELRGSRVLPFRHHDPEALAQGLAQAGAARPWVVSDGYCTSCSRPAPLAEYLEQVRRAGGRLVIDDTQAIGVLGASPSPAEPYGRGGGGSLRHSGLSGEEIVLVASLAKAFGAPLAMLAGSKAAVERFAARDGTLVHCSPPPIPSVAAALRALAVNAAHGEPLRARLRARVATLRRALQARGFTVRGGLFPIQRVPVDGAAAALDWQARLARRGIRVFVQRSRCRREIALTFIVTARHGEAELQAAAEALAAAARGGRGSRLELPSTMEA
jgi:8-amino-7-oxononanoate synthase